MINQTVRTILATTLFAASAFSQAKNVILFIGDGAGVSSLNAASIYGYGKPQALYMNTMPHLALADTSSAKEWVTDGAACASAWATGVKTRNGVVSMSAEAERDVKDGEIFKTVFEYAQEKGLSTGVISNEDHAGVTDAVVSAFYAHHNNRGRSGEIFMQLLHAKYGNGPDVVIGTGRKAVSAAVEKDGLKIAAEAKAKGYVYVNTMEDLAGIAPGKTRVIALLDDENFDFTEAVRQAVARLSQNPKGFILVAHSDCHLGKTRQSLDRVIKLDSAIRSVGEPNKSNTLVLFTADHSYDLRIKGETLTETQKASDPKRIASVVSLEDQHTAEEVPLLGMGPGSERIGGFMSNTDVFRVIMANYGWASETARR
jgi:alkaline phosphatase